MANRVLRATDSASASIDTVSIAGRPHPSGRFAQQWAFLSFYRRCLGFNLWLSLRASNPDRAAEVLEIRRRLSETCKKFFEDLSERDLVHCRFEGFENSSEWKGSILVANHPSILDALCFFWKMPGIGCVVGMNPWGNPLLSRPARALDFVPRDPALRMLKECRWRLRAGENILLFPEGTRTTRGALNPFLEGPALMSVKSRAPIRTFFIECNSLFLGKGYSFFHRTSGPIVFRFSAGEVFTGSPGESARCLARRLEDYYRGELLREGDRIFRRSGLAKA
jgi:1-acyl-sn-glycerol-3-phosphate acyltransferase